MTPQEIEALKAERDALLAQVQRLVDAGNEVYAELQQWALCESHEETEIAYKAWLAARSKTPQQCLRDVHTEAGRAGYLEGYVDALGDADEIDKEHAAYRANEYAAKVRQGGAE